MPMLVFQEAQTMVIQGVMPSECVRSCLTLGVLHLPALFAQ